MNWKLISDIAGFIVVGALAIWGMWRWLKRSEDPARLILKWILTGVALIYMIFFVLPMMAQGGYSAAFGGIPAAAVGGLFLAMIWRHDIAGLIAKPFESLYDGGSQEIEPTPVYSAAQTHRNRGRYQEAI